MYCNCFTGAMPSVIEPDVFFVLSCIIFKVFGFEVMVAGSSMFELGFPSCRANIMLATCIELI